MIKPISVVLLSAASLLAQQPRTAVQTVVAHGEAVLNVKPDQARIQLGVVSEAATATLAGGQNAKATSEVIAALKRTAGNGAEIKTVNYSVYPNYTQPRDGKTTPTIASYTARNIVEVKMDNLADAGKVIDVATKAGANNVQGIDFLLKDEQSVRGDALKQAALQARENATALAGALGMRIVRIIRVEDSGSNPVYPVRRMEMMQRAVADAAPTPVEPGTVQMRANVTITAELGQ